MIKFNDKVRINAGFFAGLEGTVVDTEESYHEGAGVGFYNSYTVNLDCGISRKFAKEYLEKVGE